MATTENRSCYFAGSVGRASRRQCGLVARRVQCGFLLEKCTKENSRKVHGAQLWSNYGMKGEGHDCASSTRTKCLRAAGWNCIKRTNGVGLAQKYWQMR